MNANDFIAFVRFLESLTLQLPPLTAAEKQSSVGVIRDGMAEVAQRIVYSSARHHDALRRATARFGPDPKQWPDHTVKSVFAKDRQVQRLQNAYEALFTEAQAITSPDRASSLPRLYDRYRWSKGQ